MLTNRGGKLVFALLARVYLLVLAAQFPPLSQAAEVDSGRGGRRVPLMLADNNPSHKKPFIHPTADVSPLAKIGPGVAIWNWTQIREGAVIGAGTTIGQSVYVGVDVVIGQRCRIMGKDALDTGVEIGDDVFIGPYTVFTNDSSPRAWSRRNLKGIRWFVREGASLGSHVVVLPDVCIGHHAMVTAHSVVSREVPPHALMCGSPARRVGWVCTEGHPARRAGVERGGTRYVCPEGHEVLILDSWR